MKKVAIFLTFLCFLFNVASIQADCVRCKMVKEHNEKNPNPYQYYEDYLKAKENGDYSDIKFDVEEYVK